MEDYENSRSIEFLFDITKQIKHSYETPVIFVTKSDFSDIIFDTMCNIRMHIKSNSKASKLEIIDAIVEYHLEWLNSVNDVEAFTRRVKENVISRDEIFVAINFTIDAMEHRLKYYKRYMEKYKSKLSNLDQIHLQADLEIVEDMYKDVNETLKTKKECFRQCADDEEFKIKVLDAASELLSWLDKINDGLSMQLSKYINMNIPQFTGDMNKTLQQIVDELQNATTDSAQELLTELKNKGRELSTMIRSTQPRNLEISKVVEKIRKLEDRIERLENEPTSAAVMALKRKKEFLEKRLESIENLKTTLKQINAAGEITFDHKHADDEICSCEDFFQLRIFNHMLPPEGRERLVTELCYLWDTTMFGEKTHKSYISILSVAETKEEFTDEIGTFYIDDYSRKIYKILGDDTLYQLNEVNELVPLSDDTDHVYFYDECGRYFIDEKTRERVYKAFTSASEYVLDTTGLLVKIKEEREGTTYYYDNFGRYYINSTGKHIYCEEDRTSEYENDGLGNLVRIRSQPDIFQPCPDDVHVTDDFKYLKCVVGAPLRKCIAEVILKQPADPIKYLAGRLIHYRQTMEIKDKRAEEKEELEAERKILREEREAAERRAAALEVDMGAESEGSFDSNLINYVTHDPDAISATTV